MMDVQTELGSNYSFMHITGFSDFNYVMRLYTSKHHESNPYRSPGNSSKKHESLIK
jgi:hypothetical protein